MEWAHAYNGQGGESFFPLATLLLLIGFGLWTASVARSRNRNSIGWFLAGFFLQVFALLVVYNLPKRVIPGSTKRCIQCLDTADVHLETCPHCGARFTDEGGIWRP